MNTENLDYYRVEKSRLLASYRKLEGIGLPLLSRIKRTPDWIASCVEELESNRFKLFIAGQMNCGKSTLANALLFGKVILPVYDAVMTSAITLIEHVSQSPARSEGFKVEFYSPEEWQVVRSQSEASERQATAFNNTIAHVRALGVVPAEVIGSGTIFIEGYEKLPEYVTPATKFRQGKYSPFVKSVTIYADNDLLRDLVVVDTPGTNDPNEQRARLTEDWIRQADAVVFVSYAGQALPAEDIKFINHFMLHVPATHRIIAVNKVDTIQSAGELEGYLNDLRNDQRESIRQVFSASTPTVIVCALGGLIESYRGELPETILGDRKRLGDQGFLVPEHHRINELRAVIEERLLKNKGDFILLAHKEKVESTIQLAINALEADIAEIDARIFERTRSIDKLNADATAIGTESTRIQKLCEEFTVQLGIESKKAFSFSPPEQIGRIVAEEMMDVKVRLKKAETITELRNDADWIQKNAIENAARKFANFSENIWDRLQEELGLMIKALESDLGQNSFLSERQICLAIDKAKLLNLNHLAQNAFITPEQFAKVVSDAQKFVARLINTIFGTKFNIEECVADVSTAIRRSMETVLDEKLAEFKKMAYESTAQFSEDIEQDMRQLLDRRRKDLKYLIDKKNGNEDEKSSDEFAKEKIYVEIDRIRKLSFNL